MSARFKTFITVIKRILMSNNNEQWSTYQTSNSNFFVQEMLLRGCHIMAMPLGFIIQRQILWQQRPRSYKSHITFQDIDKLWELIDGGGTDNLSDFCQTVSIRQQLAVGITLVRHCLELNRLENLFVLTRPVLREEDTFETILVGEEKKNDSRNK